MEKDLQMRTFSCFIMEPDGCRWLMLERIQTARSSSLPQRQRNGWMGSTSSLEWFWKAWLVVTGAKSSSLYAVYVNRIMGRMIGMVAHW